PDQDDTNGRLKTEDAGSATAVYLAGYFAVNHGTDVGREELIIIYDNKVTSLKFISFDVFFNGSMEVDIMLPKGLYTSN
ncbi:hypothetical protein NAI77_10310, partial [Francisella tularensis subsp. holarctica]|nr:hypothetical protein [Francisella tularensis subsp. holarctica]